MALQNRVTPFGDIVATPARGTFMGNRGNLHGPDRRLRDRRWSRLAWITCLLEFKGRHRRIMTPGSYTELFFLDEVTALAAGHRPCAECRRADYREFKRLWLERNPAAANGMTADAAHIDAVIHRERVCDDGSKRTWCAAPRDLPDGVFVVGDGGDPCLLWRRRLFAWSAHGYGPAHSPDPGRDVLVLTPPSLTAVLAGGYAPAVHSTTLL